MITVMIAWILLTFGLSYLASSAEILHPIRIRLVAWKPWTALLLSCRSCTSFWTSQASAAIILGIAYSLGIKVPWFAWIYLLPTAGVAAIGLIDFIVFIKRGGNSDA